MTRRLALPILLAAGLLWARCSSAQQAPEQALAEMVEAKEEPEVLPHLPQALGEALAKAPEEQREEFLRLFLVRDLLAAENVDLSRISEVPLTYELAEKGGQGRVTVSHLSTELHGNLAAVYFQITPITGAREAPSGGPEQQIFAVDMRLEGNAWRFLNVERHGKRQLPDMDQPELVLRMLAPDKASANEAAAVGSLRTLNTAQVTYASTYANAGFSPDLKSLGPSPDGNQSATSEHADLVDAALGCAEPICVKSGYKILYQRVDKEHYRLSAMPVEYRVTGMRSFFTDESGVIRVTMDDREAHEGDEPLQ